ncbi:MAG: VPLPA-CTERM sorting domain-containing protein [Pseudomonadota bacterium]
MFRTQLCAAALVVLTSIGASAATKTIDFEAFAPGTVLNDVDLGGVKLKSQDNILVSTSDPTGLGQTIEKDPFFGKPYKAKFMVSGVRNVSIDVGDFGGDEDKMFLKAYNASGDMIAKTKITLDEFASDMLTLSVSTTEDIKQVVFGSKNSPFPHSVYADNLAFDYAETAPVPLPAGAFLMLTALAGLGFVARRRKAA